MKINQLACFVTLALFAASCGSISNLQAKYKYRGEYRVTANVKAPAEAYEKNNEVAVETKTSESKSAEVANDAISASTNESAVAVETIVATEKVQKSAKVDAAVSKKEIKKAFKSEFAKEKNGGTDGFSLTSFIMGLLAILTSITIVGGFVFGFFALLFGIIGLVRTRGGKRGGKGFAIAGLIMGILTFGLIVVAFM